MTVRELRELLFNVNNQNLTIAELRSILFRIENQDKELNEDDLNI
jgi:hypothetical protein